MTRAEALRDHARIEEMQRNARQSTRVIERRAQEIAAARSAQEPLASIKGPKRGS